MTNPLLIFKNPNLLCRALTHRSYVNEHPETGKDNERLEFLGDAILNFLSGEYLYQHPSYPDMGEDEMSRRRAALVDEKQLAKFALEIGLDTQIKLGKGAIQEGGYQNKNLLSSAFEAVVGAYYLDQDSNINAVRICIIPLFNSVPEINVQVRFQVDCKNQFQEWVQSQGITTPPRYQTQKIAGKDHDPEFLAIVFVAETEYGKGTGKSKKEAQKRAAENALKKVNNL